MVKRFVLVLLLVLAGIGYSHRLTTRPADQDVRFARSSLTAESGTEVRATVAYALPAQHRGFAYLYEGNARWTLRVVASSGKETSSGVER